MATTVQRIYVREGDSVKPGQILVQLEDSAARAQLAKALSGLRAAEASLQAARAGGTQEEVVNRRSDIVKAQSERDSARSNLDALKRLQEKGAASPGEVSAAEARLRNAEAALSALQQTQSSRYSSSELARFQAQVNEARAAYQAAQDVLKQSDVRAPRAGTVYSLPIRQGQFLNAGDLLVQVANLDSVQVRAYVDEPEIGRLAKGQPVRVTWDAIPGRTWQGQVSGVPSTVVTIGTRVVGEVTSTIDNSDHKLLPNVNVSVIVITAERQNALTVPRGAVHDEKGKYFLYEIVGNKLQQREVKIGATNLTRTEITSGISDNALIALSTQSGEALSDGMEVRQAKEQ
jgi:HlyD family secretion protein